MVGVRVKIAQGELSGIVRATDEGFVYNSFLGIPYAKPPIGDLRFKDPQLPEPWIGVREAMLFGKINPQVASPDTMHGDEDSLFLNVYVPSTASSHSKLPVMVWIHGGGFVNGSGNSDMYGPDNLIQENVIVVTFNYRLGVLGFLCLNTAEVPGNAGLKDQVFALRWIQANIEKFGGDPGNVTVFGESAGAASVHCLMLSRMSEGLFKRAIVQSGSVLARWAMQNDAETNAFTLAKNMGCNSNDRNEILNFLQSAPIHRLMNSYENAFSVIRTNTFLPVIEQEFAGVESIISRDPLVMMKNGEYNNVSCIWGQNSGEGFSFFMDGIRDGPSTDSKKDIVRMIEALLPIQITNKKETASVVNKIENIYFTDDDILCGYARLFGDLSFTIDINQSIETMSDSGLTIYFYNFSYSGSLNLLKPRLNVKFPGATHADELGYLFKQDMISETTQSDIKMKKLMTEMWTNFAKHGNPSPKSISWKSYNKNEINCLEINENLAMISNPNAKYIAFWNDLMK